MKAVFDAGNELDDEMPSMDTSGDIVGSKHALLIASHYPPSQESSGYLRVLAFSRYLSEFGWNPIVLTASVRAYSSTDPRQYSRIPESVPVVRAFARDAREHFSIRHRYPALLGVPDRLSSWWFGGVPVGLWLIRHYRPEIIWATQPNVTGFWIGYTLHRLTRIPWIADFRDPITAPGDNRLAQKACRWIERKTIDSCSRAVFTAPGAARLYAKRYPETKDERWTVIPNGYDEPDFAALDGSSFRHQGPLRLVHSGALYPDGRDPSALFAAVARLKNSNVISARDLQISLRGTAHDAHHLKLIRQAGIDDIVRVEPAVSYKKALAEICEADGLMVLQGKMHNAQIPAKIYEYMRARKPIFALTDADGDTGRLLKDAGIDTVTSLDDSEAIATSLVDFINRVRMGNAPVATDSTIADHSRRARTRQLAAIFNSVAAAG